VILAQSMIATPRRVKSDPVSLHAKRAAQWKLDPYLSLTKKHNGSPIDAAPARATVKNSKRRVNAYVVPTAKSRDDLVWETRTRLRRADADAGGTAARTPAVRSPPRTA
jgi:hypothetical protein